MEFCSVGCSSVCGRWGGVLDSVWKSEVGKEPGKKEKRKKRNLWRAESVAFEKQARKAREVKSTGRGEGLGLIDEIRLGRV